MADHQVAGCSVNNTLPLENAFTVNVVKEEECKYEYFVDDKVEISETAIFNEVQHNLICDEVKQYDISTSMNNTKTKLSLPKMEYGMIKDNPKIEEVFNVNDIKIEFNNGLLYCEDCQVYREDYCVECGMLVHILNKTFLGNVDTKSQDELPKDILEIREHFGEYRIFTLKVIPVGVKFGPFTELNTAEHPWKIKGGKFVVNEDKSKYLNWMQYINPARHILERNLRVFQYEHNLYYESTCQIEEGTELLVHFGDEYDDSLNKNVEMDFIPTRKHIFKDAYACTFCCFGFSSKLYLAKHKTICPGNAAGEFTIEELMQCPSCKIHLHQKEYFTHHMAYCCKTRERNFFLPTSANRAAQKKGRKTQPRLMYKCQQCKYKTKYRGNLKNHINQHCEVKTYKCGICCRRYKTKEYLRLHVENTHVCAGEKDNLEHSTVVYGKAHIKTELSRSQDKMKRFKCSLCEFRTKYNASLKRHTAEKHLKVRNYKCDWCDYKTNRKPTLMTHMETSHLKEFKYKCDACEYKTNLRNNLKAHIKVRHLRVFNYKCDLCNYGTNVKSNLKRHVWIKHLKEFQYKCDRCDYKTNRKSDLKPHIQTTHLNEFKYKCDQCDYKTNRKSNLKVHVEAKHLKKFKYMCDRCDYKTIRNDRLESHIQGKHLNEFKYKCDTCDYKTNGESNLKTHIDTRHLKEFKYKCDTCDYKTNLKGSLKRHEETRRHLKDRNYKCDKCDYEARKKSSLERHMEIRHLKEFKYKCDICDYKANAKSSLKIHINTRHLKEFKYKCVMCNYETNLKCNLKTHIETRRHLKEFKYKCGICDYKTNCKSDLKKHIEGKHLKEI